LTARAVGTRGARHVRLRPARAAPCQPAMGIAVVAGGDVAVVAFFGKLGWASVAARGTGNEAALWHERLGHGVATRAERAHAAPPLARSKGGVDGCARRLGRRAGVGGVAPARARRPQRSGHGDPLAPDHEVGAGNATGIGAVDPPRDPHLTALDDDRAALVAMVVAGERPWCGAATSRGTHLAVRSEEHTSE